MTDVLHHTAALGDRWDLLADLYYGDPLRFEPLLRANPDLASAPILPPGAQILVPILDEVDSVPATLPPWRLG
jgi:hypothetical protein